MAKVRVDIVGDASSLERAFKKAGGAAGGFGSTMAKVGKVAAVGLGVGMAAAAVGIKKSVAAALDAEQAQTRLNQAFKSVSATAKEQAASMAAVSRVSRRAGLDDEDLMDSLGRLARVTKDTTKAQEGMAIAADIARARNVSLESATQIVAKAHLGQLGALKRIGIEIPKVTTAQDALKASGDKVTQAQKDAAKAADELATRQGAVAALQQQFAGSAAAYGNTTSGAVEKAKVAWENLQETLGAKLLPVVGRVSEWFLRNMPTIERVITRTVAVISAVINGLTPVFSALIRAIGTVAEAAQRYWPQVQEAAAKVVAWYRGTLAPAIENVLNAVRKAWEIFGPAITRVATAAFNQIRTVVTTAMRIIGGLIEAALALIRGDWGEAWNKLKQVARAALDGVVATVRNLGGLLYDAAVAVGKRLVQGLIDGISAMGGALMDKARDIVSSVKNALKVWESPPETFGAKIGSALIQGMITGIDQKLPNLKTKTEGIVSDLKDTLTRARSGWDNAWSEYTSSALAAFDDMAAKVKTKSEKVLDALRTAREKSSIKQAIGDARASLAEAQAGGDPDAIVSAQRQLDEALFRQKEYGLEQRAAVERKKLDEATAVRRMKFEEQLTELGTQYLRSLAKHGEGQASILKKIQGFEEKYQIRGKALGDALARGIDDARGGVVDAANRLAAAIARAMGVAADIPKTAADKSTASSSGKLKGFAAGGSVRGGVPIIVGEQGPEIFVPGSGGSIVPNGAGSTSRAPAGGNTFNISFPNYLGSREEIVQLIRTDLIKLGRNNAGNVFAGVA